MHVGDDAVGIYICQKCRGESTYVLKYLRKFLFSFPANRVIINAIHGSDNSLPARGFGALARATHTTSTVRAVPRIGGTSRATNDALPSVAPGSREANSANTRTLVASVGVHCDLLSPFKYFVWP